MLNCSDGSMLFSSKKRGDASIRGGQVSDGGAQPQKKSWSNHSLYKEKTK